jgi:hypothetical protein
MLKERHNRVLAAYATLHRHRRSWFSPKFRLAVILLAAAASWLAYQHFSSTYPAFTLDARGSSLPVHGLMFNAFVAGAIFGMVLYGLITEGEYLLGLKKIIYASMPERTGMARRKPQLNFGGRKRSVR